MFCVLNNAIFYLLGGKVHDLKTLNKSDKMKIAEKHLGKYISELKRHFEFSDFQLISLLENLSVKMRKNRNLLHFSLRFNFFQRKK